MAGSRVLLDAVERGGAVMFVLSADRLPGRSDFELLAELAQTHAAVFFVVTPRADGTWLAPASPGREGAFVLEDGSDLLGLDVVAPDIRADDPAAGAVEAHRLAIAAAVPALAEAPWFAVDPATTDTAYLRRALVEWAAGEAMSRASDNPPVPPGATRTVRVVAEAHESDWAERLERQARNEAHAVRQRLAIELANIHLRVVQDIVFGAGHAGLPAALDREVHALSLRAVAECDAVVDKLVDDGGHPGLRRGPGRGCTASDRGRRTPRLRRRPRRARPRQGAAGDEHGRRRGGGRPGRGRRARRLPGGARPHRPALARRGPVRWLLPPLAGRRDVRDEQGGRGQQGAFVAAAGHPGHRAGAAAGDLAPDRGRPAGAVRHLAEAVDHGILLA